MEIILILLVVVFVFFIAFPILEFFWSLVLALLMLVLMWWEKIYQKLISKYGERIEINAIKKIEEIGKEEE